MKLWVDDMRPAPGDCFHEWAWCKAVNTAKTIIEAAEKSGKEIELIDLDHDAGDYANDGGDYIKLLDRLEETRKDNWTSVNSNNFPVVTYETKCFISRILFQTNTAIRGTLVIVYHRNKHAFHFILPPSIHFSG